MSSNIELRKLIMAKFMSNDKSPIQTNFDNKQETNDYLTEKEYISEENKSLNGDVEILETFYIDDDPLSRVLEHDLNKSLTVHFLLYKKIDELAIPFLEFYFEKKNDLYCFPSITIDFSEKNEDPNKIPETIEPIEEIEQKGGDDDNEEFISDEKDILYDKCSPFLMELLNINSEDCFENYKGFIETNNNECFIVFDCTELDWINENDESIIAILDEIINKNSILNIPVDPKIIDLFNKYEYMKYIVDKKGHPVEIPVCLYMCEKINGINENLYYENNKKSITDESYLDIQHEHPILGSVYLFSETPFDSIETNKLKRHAVFIQNTLYIMNRDFPLEENIHKYKEDFNEFSAVSFYEGNNEIYAAHTNGIFTEI